MPKVSIIIPTYNYGKYIKKAIDSVFEQSYRSFEIIVVDDGSTDDTMVIIEGKYKEKVRYFFQENKGASAARNKGVKESRGEYLIFLDADDALGENQLFLFESFSRKYPNDVIYCHWKRYIEFDGEYDQVYSSEKFKGIDMLDSWLKGWYVANCCILWPKRVIQYLGGWDKSLLANQDGDIAMRALIKGIKFHYCPGVYAWVRDHSSHEPLSISNSISRESLNSRLYVIRKIEKLINKKRLFKKYRKALSESYYNLAHYHWKDQPDFSRVCYKHFKRVYRFSRPPGSILNWIFVTILGIEKKGKLAYLLRSLFSKK